MFAKWLFALLLFWLVAGKASTPAEYQYPIPSQKLDAALSLFAIPGTSLDPAQIQLLQKIHAMLVKLEGANAPGLDYAIRHGGTSIDLVMPPETDVKRSGKLHWVLYTLGNPLKPELFVEEEYDEDGNFYHVTPLCPLDATTN